MTAPRAAIQAALATHRGDDPALTGTRAQLRHCRNCRRLVLAGYDAPLIAALAITDPYTATPMQEAAAVILDRPTYRLHGWPLNPELAPRFTPGLHPIGRAPAADQVLVVITHACGTPPLATNPLPALHASGSLPDTPPF